jgi:hypothetical protein
MNNTKFETSFTLKRECEAGNSIDTKIQYIQGVPMVMVVTQGTNRIEFTPPEAVAFQYAIREFGAFKSIVGRMNSPDTDDDD